jgi:lambda family phage portal protein
MPKTKSKIESLDLCRPPKSPLNVPRETINKSYGKSVSRGTFVRSNQYAAAKTSRINGVWPANNNSVNSYIEASSPTVRARTRQLVRDYPHLARWVDLRARYIVNTGIGYQSKVADYDRTKNTFVLNKEINRRQEEEWKLFSDKKEFDIAKKLSFDAMEQLACRQDGECGEYIIQRHFRPDRRFGVCYQIFEPDFLSSFGGKQLVKGPNVEISQGVEYNIVTGEVYAYHFYDSLSGKDQTVSADQILHNFFVYRPGQLRGITSFAPGIILADTLKARIDNELSRSALAAQWLAFVKTPDPLTRQATIGPDGQPVDMDDKIEDIENGIIDYLRPGEEITLSGGAPDPAGFNPFVKFILQMASIIDGMPYELMSGDYEGMSYTTLRAKRNDFGHELKVPVARFVEQYNEPIKWDFLQYGVLRRIFPYRDFFTNPMRYGRCRWMHPGMPPIDPLKENKADINAIDGQIMSPQEQMAKTGRDIDEVYQEIASAKEKREEYGIENEPNAPSAVDPDKEDK